MQSNFMILDLVKLLIIYIAKKYGEVWRDSLDLSGSINNGSIIRKIFHKKILLECQIN